MFSSLVIHVLSKWVRRMSLVALVSCGGVVVLSTARPCAAASTAFDSAANPTYNTQPDGTTGWVTGSNGGHGFGPWQAFNVPSGFPFGGLVASSTTNGTGDLDNDGDINTPRNASGRAWGLAAAPARSELLDQLRAPDRVESCLAHREDGEDEHEHQLEAEQLP